MTTVPEKLLLIGPGSSGKTSMRSVIFENSTPRDAMRIRLTLAIFQGRVELLNNLTLNITDCGSQVDYVHHYLGNQREYVFGNVGVMIFVVDIGALSRDGGSMLKLDHVYDGGDSSAGGGGGPSGESSHWPPQDGGGGGDSDVRWNRAASMEYFAHAMSSVIELSKDAKLFVMLHKMDLIRPENREPTYKQRVEELKQALAAHLKNLLKKTESEAQQIVQRIVFFPTTLWDSSVFHAYSVVVRTLVPEREQLDEQLTELVRNCGGFEAAIFEKRTMLCLAHVDQVGSIDTMEYNQTLHTDFEHHSPLPSDENMNGSNRGDEYDEDPQPNPPEVAKKHVDREKDAARANVISEVFKLFKLRCSHRAVDMKSCSMSTPEFSAVLRVLTKGSMVLFVSRDPTASLALHELHVDAWIRKFTEEVPKNAPKLAAALSMTSENN